VVIDNFDFVGIGSRPAKANAPLVVDPNAVLTGSVTRKLLQMVCRRNSNEATAHDKEGDEED